MLVCLNHGNNRSETEVRYIPIHTSLQKLEFLKIICSYARNYLIFSLVDFMNFMNFISFIIKFKKFELHNYGNYMSIRHHETACAASSVTVCCVYFYSSVTTTRSYRRQTDDMCLVDWRKHVVIAVTQPAHRSLAELHDARLGSFSLDMSRKTRTVRHRIGGLLVTNEK